MVYWLVVLTILKNMKVNGKDYPIYEMEKMFETTNQKYLFHTAMPELTLQGCTSKY